jgi:hypothetical protein
MIIYIKMSVYNQPLEYLSQFNTKMFGQPDDTISQAEGNQLYLSKTISDTSTAPLTTFDGQVVFNNQPPSSNTTPSLPAHLATLAYLTSFYQPISLMVNYLTTAVASTTYLTIANAASTYLSITNAASTYLTQTNATSTYQTIADMVNYLTTASASAIYLTIASASSTYQTIAGMSVYLTIANASSTYQTIANMANYLTIVSASTTYLTIASASSTYQTIAGMSVYLTIANASSTYQTIADMVNYLTIASASTIYLTIANASSTYQTIAGMTIYQTIANMTNYVSRTGSVNEDINGIKTFLSVPVCATNANTNNQLVNWQTLNGQQFTTLSLVQSNANTFTSQLNKFNQTIKLEHFTAQFTELTHTAQNFHIYNRAVGPIGTIKFWCKNSSLADTEVAAFQVSGISLGVSTGSNTISGTTTFNQDVSVTNLLTATGGLKTNAITPLVGSGQNDIYSSLPIGGTIVFGTASRTMNIYGNVNMVNNCQFSGFLPTSTITASSANELVNFTCLNAQLFVKPSFNNVWTGTNSFNSFLPTSTITASSANELVNFTCLNAQSFVKPSFNNVWTGTNSFNSFLPTSTLTPSSGTQLITKTYADGKFIDFLTDQTITGIKRFDSVFCTSLNITPTSGGGGNRQQVYITGDYLVFVPQFNNNNYAFQCRDGVPNLTTPLNINYLNTTIANNLISNGEATFNTWVYLKFRTRIYDVSSPNTNYTNMYMIGNNEFVIGPNSNGDFISFYCKDATLGTLQTFKSSALGNTSLVNLTCSASLITNNLTSPSTTGTNNIYTNLNTTSGGGIINIGAIKNNINIKCSLNIVESVYGTTPTKITTINQEGDSCRFTNNGSSNGDFIFEINESGTYNPLVINKTSVDIAGDALVFGDLILYDTTPSTKNVIIGMVGNDLFFTPSFNTSSSSYNFKVADSGSTITTPLIINSTNTTIANNLISNSQATLNGTTYVKDFRWIDVGSPFTNAIQSYISGTNLAFVPLFANNTYTFYCKDAVPTQTSPLTISSASTTIANNLISNSQATFNSVAPISNTAPTLPAHLTTRAYVDSVSGSSILSLNNTFTGYNTYTNGLTIRNTLLIKDSTNVQESSINLTSGLLGIGCSVNSGKILLQTFDSTGAGYTRLTADANEINITAPLTLFLDYTYYNPFNFSSTRLGYSMSNTGSTNTLTNNTANNSGQINIPAGSWTISYTGTITVITGTLTTLTSLEIYVADDLTNDLNIIGINVINYYQLSSVPVGKKMRISGSGTYISYINTNTELNLRLLPLFTGGSGGLNFQGKISVTRNA